MLINLFAITANYNSKYRTNQNQNVAAFHSNLDWFLQIRCTLLTNWNFNFNIVDTFLGKLASGRIETFNGEELDGLFLHQIPNSFVPGFELLLPLFVC